MFNSSIELNNNPIVFSNRVWWEYERDEIWKDVREVKGREGEIYEREGKKWR